LRARLEEERKNTAPEPERTLSQEIELRIRESFDFDKSKWQLLGGTRHYWLVRLVADVIVQTEYQTGRRFLSDRFTFDLVKNAIATVLDHSRPAGMSAPPEHLIALLGEEATKTLGKNIALLALAAIELAPMHGFDLPVLPDTFDPNAAARRIPAMRKSAVEELNKSWLRSKAAAKTTTTKSRRRPK
jgi:hypothetical protein